MASVLSDTTGQLLIQIVEKLDAMYARSLNTMVIYLSLLVLIVGVLIPLLTAFYQRKLFRVEEARLSQRIVEQVALLRSDLVDLLEQSKRDQREAAEKTLRDLEAKVARGLAHASSGAAYLQAHYYADRQDYVQALTDYAFSAKSSLEARDEENVQKALDAISRTCLLNLTSQDLDASPEALKKLENVVEQLEQANTDGRYSNYLRDIAAALRSARQRKREDPE